MPALLDHQAAFGKALAKGPDPSFLDRLVAPGQSAVRFAAYRRNVRGNLVAALTATYPVLAQLVGEAHFEALCATHVATQPSCDGDLNAYGAGFANVVAADPIAADYPWLPDVARLEWALQAAYAAADPAPLALERLLSVPPERQADVRLGLWPGATLMDSRWPVGAIWRVHQRDAASIGAALAALDPAPGQYAVLATRDAFGVPQAIDFSPGEACLWQACLAGLPLSAALEAALAEEPGLPAAGVLPRWFAGDLIVGIES